MSSLPEFSTVAGALDAISAMYGCEIGSQRELPVLKHGFTHYSLSIQPIVCEITALHPRVTEPGTIWLPVSRALQASIPAPVRTLLLRIPADEVQ